jgi:TRAP-type C4-dicarboxylate transport system permease small subunit
MHLLTKIDDALEYMENAIVVALFAALILLIAFNILARNLFGISFPKTLELTPAIVLWIALIGATLALKKGRHIKLEILLRYTGRRARRAARIVSGLFGTAVMATLFVASLSFVKNEWAIFGFRGAASLAFPLFFALASFRYLLGSFATGAQSAHPEDGQNGIGGPSGTMRLEKEDS